MLKVLSSSRTFIILVVIGFALFVIGILTIHPVYVNVCEKTAEGAQHNCTFHNIIYVAFWKIVESLFDGTFITGLITAVATAVIAWFTGTIRKVNRDQLYHSRQVERAYVKISHHPPGLIFGPAANHVSCALDAKNHGRTPARITH